MIDTEELRPDKRSNQSEKAGLAGGIIASSRAIDAVFHDNRLAA